MDVIEHSLKWLVLSVFLIILVLFFMFAALIDINRSIRATPTQSAPTPMIVYVDRPLLVPYPAPVTPASTEVVR